jgi:uncharacterized protein
MKYKCPICKKEFDALARHPEKNKYFPFCSERCKLIDLGAWLDAEYKVISQPGQADEDQIFEQ